MLGITVKKWNAIRGDILALMTDEGHCLSQKWLDREIAKAKAISMARAERVEKGSQKTAGESEKIEAELCPHARDYQSPKLWNNITPRRAIADTHARAP